MSELDGLTLDGFNKARFAGVVHQPPDQRDGLHGGVQGISDRFVLKVNGGQVFVQGEQYHRKRPHGCFELLQIPAGSIPEYEPSHAPRSRHLCVPRRKFLTGLFSK